MPPPSTTDRRAVRTRGSRSNTSSSSGAIGTATASRDSRTDTSSSVSVTATASDTSAANDNDANSQTILAGSFSDVVSKRILFDLSSSDAEKQTIAVSCKQSSSHWKRMRLDAVLSAEALRIVGSVYRFEFHRVSKSFAALNDKYNASVQECNEAKQKLEAACNQEEMMEYFDLAKTKVLKPANMVAKIFKFQAFVCMTVSHSLA